MSKKHDFQKIQKELHDKSVDNRIPYNVLVYRWCRDNKIKSVVHLPNWFVSIQDFRWGEQHSSDFKEDSKIVCSFHSTLYDESEPIEVIDDGGMCIHCQRNAEAKAERGQLQ